MYEVRVLAEYCKGCGLCIRACPVEGLERSEELSALAVYPPRQRADVECIGCLSCALICPDAAIEIIYVEETDDSRSQRRVQSVR